MPMIAFFLLVQRYFSKGLATLEQKVDDLGELMLIRLPWLVGWLWAAGNPWRGRFAIPYRGSFGKNRTSTSLATSRPCVVRRR